jgi:hypothetical protein
VAHRGVGIGLKNFGKKTQGPAGALVPVLAFS